ncbi:MAG: hypothetical protein LBD97_10745 [Bifidobacteriaceae bacterium]|jgi:hypothetical protein|nr:hypothetical protein [Bifidobacteriaceae bacterium]
MADRMDGPAPTGEGIDYRRVSVQLGLLAAALAVVAGAAGYLLDGSKGLIGALLGAGIVGVFFASSAVVMHLGRTTQAQARNLLITWFVKLIALLVVLMTLGEASFINRAVFGVTILLGIAGSLVLEGRLVWSARIPPGDSPGGDRR